jgi:hypothetical protein
MPSQILKRDGRLETWSTDRIAQAIFKALSAAASRTRCLGAAWPTRWRPSSRMWTSRSRSTCRTWWSWCSWSRASSPWRASISST